MNFFVFNIHKKNKIRNFLKRILNDQPLEKFNNQFLNT